MRIKPADIKKLPEHVRKQIATSKTLPVKKSKYNANIVEVDGIKFHSAKEAARYQVLKFAQDNSDHVQDLKLQVPFQLIVGGIVIETYIADFTYTSDGITVVEDCKGFKTRDYKRKKKWMKSVHGIEIKET